jgi:hypothetical protein
MTVLGGVGDSLVYAMVFIDVVKVAREARRTLDPTAAAATETAHFGLILDLWGAILFETRENCERARLMVEKAKHDGYLFGTFTFQVTDAVLPEFCRLAPAPRILVGTTRLLGRLRRIDVFQRAAPNTDGFSVEAAGPQHKVALGFAQDFLSKGGVQEFNDILAIAQAVARAEYKKGPEEPTDFLLPVPIVESEPPNETLL